MGDSPELVPTEVATDLGTDGFTDAESAEMDLSGTLAMPPSTDGRGLVLEENAAAANVFAPNAPSPFVGLGAPQIHMYRQQFQQNITIGETPEQTRLLLTELENEAESRHQRFRLAAEEAHDQQIADVEERANRQHEEVVARLESEIASQRYSFVARTQGLFSELQQQSQIINFQSEHFSDVGSQITRLRTTLVEEAEQNKRESINEIGEWFGREHDEAMKRYRSIALETEEQMRIQNMTLQDELSSMERALQLEQDRNLGINPSQQAQLPSATAPVAPAPSAGLSAPCAPQFSDPSVIPINIRALFPNFSFGGVATTATPTGPQGPASAPGTSTASANVPNLGFSSGGLNAGAPGLAAPTGTPGGPAATGADLIAQTQQALLEAAKLLKGDKSGEDDKPKVKEAETIRLPDFPNPETYRAWKTATREAVRAASDRPDEAFSWILEVYSKNADHDKLREPGKFLTLDTKILAALTKVAKGELSRQVLTFKETEAVQGRAVRGRQVLLMFDQYFKTNEEVGSLYSVEDLLKVTLHSDDLTTFLHNWESVIAGMSHVPEEMVLRDILLRQIRKSSRMKYDLEIYDRAKEGSASHSYAFLLKSIRDLLTRERMRKNRDRIAKSHGDKFGAPVVEGGRPTRPPSRSGRGRDRSAGSQSNSKSRSRSRTPSRSRSPSRSQSPKPVCYDFQKGKCTRGDKCKFSHKPRSQSPVRTAPKKKQVCTFWKKGKCTRGDKCRFLHREPSPTPPGGQNAAPAPKGPDKPRSPSPAPTRRKPSRGRSKEKDRKAACCISLAAAASAGPDESEPQDGDEDYWEVDFKRGEAVRHHLKYRSTMYKPEVSCPVALERLKGKAKVIKTLPISPYTAKENWDWKEGRGGTGDRMPWTGKTVFKIKEQNKKVRFCDKPKVREIPFEGKGYKHSYKVRRYNTCYADAENCPKPDAIDLQVAIRNARELKMLLARHEGGEKTDCHLECDEPDSLMCGMCKHVVESSEIACPGIATPLEFLADTGSEEDLISEADRAMYFGEEPVGNATRQVNLITANGNVKGDKSVRIDFPEFGKELEFYVLNSTPPVCSVGRRCMEDGYEFHWYPKRPPYFVAPNGQRLRCRMRGMVPVLGGGAMAAPSTKEEASGSLGRPILSEGFQKTAAQ